MNRKLLFALIFLTLLVTVKWFTSPPGEPSSSPENELRTAADPIAPPTPVSPSPSSLASTIPPSPRPPTSSSTPQNVSQKTTDPKEIQALKDGFPRWGNPVEGKTEEGYRSTMESRDGQGTIVRNFGPKGEIVSENWVKPNGDSLIRSFFPSGKIKAATLEREDSRSTYLSFHEDSDRYELKEFAPDGTSEKTVFDASGKVLERWEQDREGNVKKKE